MAYNSSEKLQGSDATDDYGLVIASQRALYGIANKCIAIEGVVENKSNHIYNNVKIVAVASDINKNLYGVGECTLIPSKIQPNEFSIFKINIYHVEQPEMEDMRIRYNFQIE